jgi:predicted PurR-regulated permease PerM
MASLDVFKKALILIVVGLLAVLAASNVVIAMATLLNTQHGRMDQMQAKILKRQDISQSTLSAIADMQAQIAQLTTALNSMQQAKKNVTLSPNGIPGRYRCMQIECTSQTFISIICSSWFYLFLWTTRTKGRGGPEGRKWCDRDQRRYWTHGPQWDTWGSWTKRKTRKAWTYRKYWR